jgi:hypothetical protein
MTTVALGAEVALDGETGAIATAQPRDGGRWHVELVFYQPVTLLPAAAAELYDKLPECPGVYIDPLPCAQVLDELRLAVWVNALEAVDVSAASAQFRAAVKAGQLSAGAHAALEQALTYATRRPLATAFGYERRRVPCDMSPLNAAAFALWGLRRSETELDPGVWTF